MGALLSHTTGAERALFSSPATIDVVNASGIEVHLWLSARPD
jgi:hypothetical protein